MKSATGSRIVVMVDVLVKYPLEVTPATERDKSAEVVVTHQPKVCDPSGEGLLGPVSRTCTMTLAPVCCPG